MYYYEEKQDLFKVEQGYVLAHCISADFALGAGIAKEFAIRYDMAKRLINEHETGFVGDAYLVDNVYNLVTKEYGRDKPTYELLAETLLHLKDRMVENGQKKLAIPQIGCGLDGLNWEIVKILIKETFKDTDIEVMVCIKPEEELEEDYENYLEDKTQDEKIEEYLSDYEESLETELKNKGFKIEELSDKITKALEILGKYFNID